MTPITTNEIGKIFNLCKKHNCFSYSELFVKSSFDEMYKIICIINPIEKINIACMLYSKWRYDLERKNRFEYLLRQTAVENNFFEELLINNHINIKEFVIDFKAWINCEHPKKNVFTIIGPPNTGKTLFISLLQQLFVSKRLNSMDMASDFLFGNLINCNLIIIEEPFFPPIMLEDFKNMAGGQTMSVNSKYLPPQQLIRTPVIISSNFNTLCHGHAASVSEQAVRARSYIYYFKAPIVINYTVLPEHLVYFLNKHGSFT